MQHIIMNDNTLFTRNAELLEATLDNEVVLLSIERGSYFGLEGKARRIWQMLAMPYTISSLPSFFKGLFHVKSGVTSKAKSARFAAYR